ncbi:MAG: hypothetical protein IJ809_05515 [Clostridia bacterium]|nr:hypothetical protein [Clostridia bacterium]
MKVISLNKIYTYRLYIIISLAIIVGISLISYGFFSVFCSDKQVSKTSILNLNSYIAKYTIKVKSNKTTNSYSIEEWYEKDESEKFRFNYLDFIGNSYSIIVVDDKYKMENVNQISKFVAVASNKSVTNLYSLATYLNIINDGAFLVSEEQEEVTCSYIIDFTSVKDDNLAKKYKSITDNSLNITRAEIFLVASKPVKISIFSDKEEKIIIDYEDFKQDEKIEDEIFEV